MKKQTLLLLLFAMIIVSVLALAGCEHVHKFGDWNVTRQPTCTDDGVAVGFCECGEQTTKVVEKTGHSYSSVVTEPTCTEQGYTTYSCRVCGDVSVDDYVDATGHNEIFHEGQPKTCTEDGWSDYVTCSRCDYSTYQVLLSTGHNFSNSICSVCSLEIIPNGGPTFAIDTPGRFVFWSEFNGVSTATVKDGVVVFEITNGGNWYSNQLFFKNPNLTQGIQYILTGKIVSDVSGSITINNSVVNIKQGEQVFSVTYTETKDPSFSLQTGTYSAGISINSITLVISDLKWETIDGEPTPPAFQPKKSWTFEDAVVEERNGEAWLKMRFTSTGYTREELGSNNWYFDILSNDLIMGGGWDMYFEGVKPTITFISDSEYVLAYNISSLPLDRGYIIHFGRQDQSNDSPTIVPEEAIDEVYCIDGVNYRLFAVPGSNQASECWGSLGLIVTSK